MRFSPRPHWWRFFCRHRAERIWEGTVNGGAERFCLYDSSQPEAGIDWAGAFSGVRLLRMWMAVQTFGCSYRHIFRWNVAQLHAAARQRVFISSLCRSPENRWRKTANLIQTWALHSLRDRDCSFVLHIAGDCKLLLETFQGGRRIEWPRSFNISEHKVPSVAAGVWSCTYRSWPAEAAAARGRRRSSLVPAVASTGRGPAGTRRAASHFWRNPDSADHPAGKARLSGLEQKAIGGRPTLCIQPGPSWTNFDA